MPDESTATRRILVIDDEPDVRNTLCGLLSDAGYIVQSAANEAEALTALTREPFDFALIDVRLHGDDEGDESGLSLAIAFRALNPQIHVIPLTRYIRAGQIVRAVRYYGVVDFIEKTPDMGEQILNTIEKVQRQVRRPKFEKTSDATQLYLSLTAGQPMVIRAHGRHVCSSRSWRVLRVGDERYARRTELARRDAANLRFQVAGIGDDLWREIFDEHREAFTVYLEARAKSQTLSLIFETPREFLRLPLEFMRSENPPEYLVLQHPLARFVYDAIPKREVISPSLLALTEKLHVLVIASNTEPPIDGVDTEARELCNFLEHQDCIPVEVTFIPTEQATYARVREELRRTSYDIVHYAGHGSYNAASPEESSLRFWAEEDKQGDVVSIQATELKMLLEHSKIRLVYLSCCSGTTTGSQVTLLDDDFLGLADAAAQAGVPSVLGFRWPVSDEGAQKLALAFYQSLLEQGSPEIALWSARCELAALNKNDPTWLSPILIHQE